MLICLNRLILWQCMPSPDTLPAKFNPAVSTDASNSLPFYSTFGRVLFLDNFRSLIASLSHAEQTNFDEKKERERYSTNHSNLFYKNEVIRSLLKLKRINISYFYSQSVKNSNLKISCFLKKNVFFSFFFLYLCYLISVFLFQE